VIRALHAEWTKVRTLPSSLWLLTATALLIGVVGAVVVTTTDVRHCPTPTTCAADTTELSLSGVLVAQVAVVVLAVLVMTSEYGTGTIRVTLTAVPHRLSVYAGKLVVVSVLASVCGAAGVLGAVTAAGRILPGNGFSPANGYPALSWSSGSTVRAAGGTVIYLVLIAVLSVGVAAIVRDTAGALIAVFAALFVSPILTTLIADPAWHRRLEKYSPMTAGLSVQSTRDVTNPWAGLVILAAYAIGAGLVGAVLLHLRDA
jgi:hypothetical protein